jgi:hypothetical protein
VWSNSYRGLSEEEEAMNAIVELVQPITKARKPLEVKNAELRAEIRELKRDLKAARRHAIELLAIMRPAFQEATHCRPVCTCTPTRADFLRAIARD